MIEGLTSVVIPCFNQKRFLRQAIGSALEQIQPTVEVIVVDDGSTDGSGDLARSFEDIRVVRQENAGLANARNAGLGLARGEFVLFLDADDWLLPRAVELGVAALTRAPSAMFAVGHFVRVDVKGRQIATPPAPVPPADPYRELLRRRRFGISVPASVLFRRAVFDRIEGFDGAFAGAEDYELYLRIAREFEIRTFQEPVAAYRRHGGGMSRDRALMLQSLMGVMEAQLPFLAGRDDLLEAHREGVQFWQEYYGPRPERRSRRRWRGRTAG
jgi:glycosyltransferase involved in cell wall biosynthesis